MAARGHAADTPALRVRDLEVELGRGTRRVVAVDRLSFEVAAGETLAIVGESGCGKSMTALGVLRLLPGASARMRATELTLGEIDLLSLSPEELRRLRGDRIAMIFQEPMTSLNPVLTVERQITETLRVHRQLGRSAARARALELLHAVRIPDPERRLQQYPFELSGGMRQRVMIAAAVSCNPDVLIADEPTTALDVTVQAQILEVLLDLKRQRGMALVLITHDLGVVAQTAQRVVVMYAGRKVEEARVRDLFANPRHPYTRGLMGSMPRLGASQGDGPRGRLPEMAGTVPVLDRPAPGCAFAPRCALADARCTREAPPLVAFEDGHTAACWRADAVIEAAHGVD
ncbi:MAG: ABC transporter ATP-binding protein [Alphaproteobacteria bacterium]|nr:ABC transporter ATP-binding protein [Alphaproteobacteria bacterium]